MNFELRKADCGKVFELSSRSSKRQDGVCIRSVRVPHEDNSGDFGPCCSAGKHLPRAYSNKQGSFTIG